MIALTKIRWGRMGKGESEIVRFREMSDIEEEENIYMISNLERIEVNLESKVITPDYKRCTSMKGNQRIIFPGGRPAKEEAAMEVRLGMWMAVVKDHYNKETKDGVQITDQLDRVQMAERKSVQMKVRKGVLHISSSNKGKGLVAMDRHTIIWP